MRSLALKVPSVRRFFGRRRRQEAELKGAHGAQREAEWRLSPFAHYHSRFDAIATMRRFETHGLIVADPNYCTNWLGVKISPKFFPGILDGKAGTIEATPIPANWHADIAEWAATLRAVDLAQDLFRVVELGCGWGCWLNNTGVAARRRGLEVELIGIEGDEGHVAFAHEALSVNGFAPGQYRVFHGVAAPKRGRALFPVVENPDATWGSAPILDATPEQIEEAVRKGGYLELDALPLQEVTDGKIVDLLHIDIQGGETAFVEQNLEIITNTVRSMVIGTHSRIIEGELTKLLLMVGWVLEIERPALVHVTGPVPETYVDGVQGWRNTRL
jgi:hypothetical protein